MKQRFKRILALVMVFLILFTGADLTIFKDKNVSHASSSTYGLVVGYFEYWKSGSNYYYEPSGGGPVVNMFS